MNTNFLLLNIISLIFASLSLPLGNWSGAGWAFPVHAGHFLTDAYIIVVLFAHTFPAEIVMVISGAMAPADFASTFLSTLVLIRCFQSEVPACFEKIPQAALGILLGGVLTLLGVWKLWFTLSKHKPPHKKELNRQHTILHLLGLGPYLIYLTLPIRWTSFPIARGAFAFLCLAARWGTGESDESFEKWSAIWGLVCSGINLFPLEETAWEGEIRSVSLWFFIVFDCCHIALLTTSEKKKEKQS